MSSKIVSRVARPIIMSSVFKSGTWLLRKIIADLTGLSVTEPEIRRGSMDPKDPHNVFCRPGHFYSWHFIPTDEVGLKLRKMHARPVFLLRNIYDLTVSMYYHFFNNIDGDIGRGAGKSEFFKRTGKQRSLEHIISGCQEPEFSWSGLGLHLQHMESMLSFAQRYPCHVVTYEQLVEDKEEEIKKIARFLDIHSAHSRIAEIVISTGFNAMKKNAMSNGRGSHFRKGEVSGHVGELDKRHRDLINNELHKHAPNLTVLANSHGIAHILKDASGPSNVIRNTKLAQA
jgi:hypothetical protein